MSEEIIPVILCGGSGTRLWPRSRAARPKPFLPLVGDSTLFEATIARCGAQAGFGAPIVVTGRAHLDHVEAQLGSDAAASVIVEPAAKNTAAAIALAALRLPEDAVMLVCPSDHHIADCAAFTGAARAAAALAREGWLVSFGIEAKAPETGFGYLKRGEAISDFGFRVARFVEKPDLERAKAFLAEGVYAWNGGIFAFRVKDFLEELAAHRPAIAEAVRDAVAQGREEGRRFHPDPRLRPGEGRVGRLCGDGKYRARRDGARRHGLVRHRQLARAPRRARTRRRWQRGDGRCRACRLPQRAGR